MGRRVCEGVRKIWRERVQVSIPGISLSLSLSLHSRDLARLDDGAPLTFHSPPPSPPPPGRTKPLNFVASFLDDSPGPGPGSGGRTAFLAAGAATLGGGSWAGAEARLVAGAADGALYLWRWRGDAPPVTAQVVSSRVIRSTSTPSLLDVSSHTTRSLAVRPRAGIGYA